MMVDSFVDLKKLLGNSSDSFFAYSMKLLFGEANLFAVLHQLAFEAIVKSKIFLTG